MWLKLIFLCSIGGPGYSSIFLVDVFVPKIKLRERERVTMTVPDYSHLLTLRYLYSY